jgi:hypothetical protein
MLPGLVTIVYNRFSLDAIVQILNIYYVTLVS